MALCEPLTLLIQERHFGSSASSYAGVTYKTSWFMMHRICEAVAPAKNDPIEGADKAVEVDETFIA